MESLECQVELPEKPESQNPRKFSLRPVTLSAALIKMASGLDPARYQCSRYNVQHPTAPAVGSVTGVQQAGVAVKHVEHPSLWLLLNKCSTTVQQVFNPPQTGYDNPYSI